MSSNCLLTTNGFCHLAIPLKHFFSFSFLFCFLSEAFTFPVQVMLNISELPPALYSYFVPQWKQSKDFLEKEEKHSISDNFRGKYNQRRNHVIECIIISTTDLVEIRSCWWKRFRRHICNVLQSFHQLKLFSWNPGNRTTDLPHMQNVSALHPHG